MVIPAGFANLLEQKWSSGRSDVWQYRCREFDPHASHLFFVFFSLFLLLSGAFTACYGTFLSFWYRHVRIRFFIDTGGEEMYSFHAGTVTHQSGKVLHIQYRPRLYHCKNTNLGKLHVAMCKSCKGGGCSLPRPLIMSMYMYTHTATLISVITPYHQESITMITCFMDS